MRACGQSLSACVLFVCAGRLPADSDGCARAEVPITSQDAIGEGLSRGGFIVLRVHQNKFLSFPGRVIDTAASQLTKTAITVTAIFIVALGYDLWYYVLGYSGVTEYKMNTPLQKIGKHIVC